MMYDISYDLTRPIYIEDPNTEDLEVEDCVQSTPTFASSMAQIVSSRMIYATFNGLIVT